MITAKGIGASKGVAVGELRYQSSRTPEVEKRTVTDAAEEVKRFQAAKAKAVAQLVQLYDRTLRKLGKENSLLFQIHQMMLEDLDYNDSVIGMIQNDKVSAEYAVSETGRTFAQMFSEMDDEYMRGRAADVKDVSTRVVRILIGEEEALDMSSDPCVLAAEDLSPSETAQIDKDQVLAIVTSGGSTSSHTAIFARTMGIPAVVAVGDVSLKESSGREVAVNGTTGELFLEPDDSVREEFERIMREQKDQQQKWLAFKGKKTETKDGRHLDLYANIGGPQDMEAVLQNDAEGIGLFRSEFLFLERSTLPTEEEQFEAYRSVAEKMDGKRVVIRTLDAGADKQVAALHLPKEDNPALGMRAIRVCLTKPEIFKTQLRALYRASQYGKIAIMFPMITSVEEVRRAKELCAEVKGELEEEGVPFQKDLELGIMIETPAAAVISDELAPEVDFFSVGTNDLTQYTLAMDRQNSSLSQFCNTHHKAILRLIETATLNAHKSNIWIGICGELAADESLTETFLKMGIDELSMAPSSILPLRSKVSEIKLS